MYKFKGLAIIIYSLILINVYAKNISVDYIDGKPTIKYEYDENSAAYGIYEDTFYQIGWDTLAVSSYQGEDNKYTDEQKSYSMGYIEGHITAPRIWNHYQNRLKFFLINYHFDKIPESVISFMTQHLKWMHDQFIQNPDDSYWFHAKHIMNQLEGIINGYNSVVKESKRIDYINFYIFNAMSDTSSSTHWKGQRPDFDNMNLSALKKHLHANAHCSSLIKVAADFSDIWFGHNTFLNPSLMTRIFKEYRFKSNGKSEKSRVSAFSGYPGSLTSVDDFYITDRDLYVTETTNLIYNNDIWDLLKPEVMLTWHRSIIANRLSDSSKEWTDIFAKYNSGTYNNQWQILDLKLIDIDERILHDNALWILEQVPGYTEAADVTQILRYGYWPSYNSAYFKTIREKAGHDDIIVKHPEFKDDMDYNTAARANIFRRDQGTVKDLESLKKLMRLNDYKNDPLSKGRSDLAIASRADLSESDPDCESAIDTKIASIRDIKGKREKIINIISGPTYDQQPPFNTENTSCTKLAPYSFLGLPKEFKFEWTTYKTRFFE
jgi:hypothetical protein